jgi:hypothetical protein
LRFIDPNVHNGLAIVVAPEPDGRIEFFKIKILIFKYCVSNILRGVHAIKIRQLSRGQDFAEIDSKKRMTGIL